MEQAAEKTAEIPPLYPLKKPVDLPEPLKTTAELLEPAQQTAEIPPLDLVKKPLDLPEPLKKTAELLEPTQQTAEHKSQSTKVEFSETIKKEEEPPEEPPEPKGDSVTSSEIKEKSSKLLEPAESTEEFPETLGNEGPEPTKVTTEPLEPEKELISELPRDLVEKAVEILPEEPLKAAAEATVTVTVQDPAEELQDSG